MSKFFFQSNHELLDEMLVDVEGLPVDLDDDVFRQILLCCGASTLLQVKEVDRRSHRLANELLQHPRRRAFARARTYQSRIGAGAARRAAHRELPTRFTMPRVTGEATHTSCAVRPCTCEETGELGVRVSLFRRIPAALSCERTCFSRDIGDGWALSMLDRWLTRDVFSCEVVIDALSGAACIGVVGPNHASESRSSNSPPQSSRHAIVVDAANGAVYVKGRKSIMALPW